MIQYNKDDNVFDNLADNHELCVLCVVWVGKNLGYIQPLIAARRRCGVAGVSSASTTEFADKKRQYQRWCVFHIAERFLTQRPKCWIKTVWSGSPLTEKRGKSNDAIFCTEERCITQLQEHWRLMGCAVLCNHSTDIWHRKSRQSFSDGLVMSNVRPTVMLSSWQREGHFFTSVSSVLQM